MTNRDWPDDWFDGLKDNLNAWNERVSAFFHRGVPVEPSGRWMNWVAALKPTTCVFCEEAHGKIIDPADPGTLPCIDGTPILPPVHPHCRCRILPLPAMKAGTATIRGEDGADWYIMHTGSLPPYYLTKNEARGRGWRSKKGNLAEVLPRTMIGGDIYWNDSKRLPEAPDRIWYEADINYVQGFRGNHRIVYSNDGLVFVTYDHFLTFIEISD